MSTFSIRVTEADPDDGLDAIERTVALVKDLRTIEGMQVTIGGELFVRAVYATPKPEPVPEVAPGEAAR